MVFMVSTYNCSDQKPTLATNKGSELVQKMVDKVGPLDKLCSKKDVEYIYTYKVPGGKTDISHEKYIFDGELSYGMYVQHQRTLPELKGVVEQGYDGENYWLKADGKEMDDAKALQRVAFNRPTNYYWFTMMQKLLDPGLKYTYLGDTTISSNDYDIVKVEFESSEDKPTDIYQLYINKETSLVDQFLFTVADFGIVDPKLMEVKYEKVENLYIPTIRRYKDSSWDAVVTKEPWITVNWTDIKFNNNLKKEIFKKSHSMDIKNIGVPASASTSLKSQLDEKKANFNERAEEQKKKIYAEGIQAVENSGIMKTAMQVGDTAPNFTLTNAEGKEVSLKDELKKGSVVLTWYRGGWCPYCNLTLHALQEELSNFKANGAVLVALTPELPDNSLTTSEKINLNLKC
jgi:thiol-disulfide isomerase/thioredoxin